MTVPFNVDVAKATTKLSTGPFADIQPARFCRQFAILDSSLGLEQNTLHQFPCGCEDKSNDRDGHRAD